MTAFLIASVVALTNLCGSVSVDTFGGRVLSYVPAGGEETLAQLADGSGGIALCWPWYVNDGPAGCRRHGVARYHDFVLAGREESPRASELRLRLVSDAATRREFPHDFALTLVVRLEDRLTLRLIAENTGRAPFSATEIIHPYFRVGDARQCVVRGLDGCTYRDNVHRELGDRRVWRGDYGVEEGSKVFAWTEGGAHRLELLDPVGRRTFSFSSSNDVKAIVWSPGETSGKGKDVTSRLAPGEWRTFVCVENGTCYADRAYVLAPGERHELVRTIAVAANPLPAWPAVTQTAKPWAYNWWMASAVDAAGLEEQCAQMEKAGFGGFHVIPIYGARGFERQYRAYLSPAWIEGWNLAVRTARRHRLGVDLTMGSGWCFGGPWVTEADAASSGMRVKRAGPGGTGYMIDPFSPTAMSNFVARFEAAFGPSAAGVERPRAFYHDSYEYMGAQPKRPGDWDAQQQATFGVWTDWCRANGYLTRNEAHGAPGNWLDLYALSDIPETEMFETSCRDVLVSKFASSAAHVTGRRLVSSETGTWLCEHFHETLGEMKRLVDLLFLSGVNHVFYHGLCYSPTDVVWPGWCFYAASQVNPRNTIWRDIGFLNAYIARCQSLFQTCEPDEDTLLYFPYADSFAAVKDPDRKMTVHNADVWFGRLPVGATARRLAAEGCAFDYVSDRQLQTLDLSRYARIVVPPTKRLPAATSAALAAFRPRPPRLEPFASAGLSFTRFRRGAHTLYFLANTNAVRIAAKLRPSAQGGSAALLHPMDGRIERIARAADGAVELALEPGETVFLEIGAGKAAACIPPPSGAAKRAKTARSPIDGPWRLEPVCGGPEWPPARQLDRLGSWSRRPDGAEDAFSGTMRYATDFDYAGPAAGCVVLDLGEVRHSARVFVNGEAVGFAFMAPYRIRFSADRLKRGRNELAVEVTGTAANRIRWNDRNGIRWKYFTDANVIAYGYVGKLDAREWPLEENGLLGPVGYWVEGEVK